MNDAKGTGDDWREAVAVAGDAFAGADGIEGLSRVIAAVADGVLVLDEAGTVVLANPAARRMFDGPDREVVGSDFGHPISTGTPVEIDVVAGGIRRSVEMRAAEAVIGRQQFLVATFRDVTERQRSDRQLREALRMREEVLAIAAHELKTPVTVISGMSVTMRDAWDALDDADRRVMIGHVADRSVELRHLVTEVLDRRATDRWSAEPSVELLAPLVWRAIDAWPDLEVTVDVADDIEVWADGGHVVEIVANLVDNARKYGAPPVEITARRVDHGVAVRIVDRGAGVPPADRASMFESGWRGHRVADSDTEGTGLGLGIVRKLVEANDGDVRYEATPGITGACLVVRLPVKP